MITWFLLLILQSAAFTWVSRARNSKSIAYAAVASMFSNSIWFVVQTLMITYVAKADMPIGEIAWLATVYTAGTTIGGSIMMWLSINFLEKGIGKT